MHPIPRYFVLAGLSLFALTAAAQESLRLCHNQDESFPWLLKRTPGVSQIMATEAAKALKIKLVLLPMPGAGCVEAVQQGRVDGAISIVFLPERLTSMVYPGPASGPADVQQRMYNNSVSLFHRKQDKLLWDGKKLQVSGVVGVRRGNFAAQTLLAMGIKVDSTSTSYVELFKRLERGEIAAAVIETIDGSEMLRHTISLRSLIEMHPQPFEREAFYTVFSKAYASRKPQVVKDFWKQMQQLRTSPEFAGNVQYLVRNLD
ncbi:ABC transporter substrate-binding protein [Uliginosibacterium sp. TH139]|uniref:substrate-binding periplasmic protein n=1 Tax=Uliginosibacterium sp. TH139 TaxID=2067453 RepID=UPI000C7A2F75|nr:transporter substrate-binding domain-containing protein [Uliginosibacterium sp. TH139]PLK50360.1 hypothetical protein C0V76_00580 [Uliginosibacterium sp. TH139]